MWLSGSAFLFSRYDDNSIAKLLDNFVKDSYIVQKNETRTGISVIVWLLVVALVITRASLLVVRSNNLNTTQRWKRGLERFHRFRLYRF